MNLRPASLLGALAIGALIGTGCGGSNNKQASSTSATTAGASTAAASSGGSGSGASVSGKTIGFVNIVPNEAAQRAESSFRDAAKILGWKVVSGSRAQDVVTGQQAVQTLLNQNVDAIVMQSVDPASLGNVLAKAKAKNVPVVPQEVGAGYAAVYSGKVLAMPDWNFGAQGEELANLFIQSVLQKTNGKGGNIIVFTGLPVLPSQQLWLGALKNQLKYAPELKIVASHSVDYTKPGDDITNYLGQQLKAHPDVKGIFTIANLEAPATASAVKAAGLEGKVVITTLFGDKDLLELIRQGAITGLVDVPTDKGSWLSADALAAHFAGKPVDKFASIRDPLTAKVITKENVPAAGQPVPYADFKPGFTSKWCKEYKAGC
jgi:ribose transport system substrate-binding protein